MVYCVICVMGPRKIFWLRAPQSLNPALKSSNAPLTVAVSEFRLQGEKAKMKRPPNGERSFVARHHRITIAYTDGGQQSTFRHILGIFICCLC